MRTFIEVAPQGAFFIYGEVMAARSISTATISFGLVTVPVRVYPATRLSAGLSFHMLHAKDKVRLKQQYVCPKDEEVVPRTEMVKGYEYAKDKYVVFTNEELKALDEQATNGIEITEFLPVDAVDPVYFEKTYYLGPDKGGEKAFSLLAEAMEDAGRIALAQYAARGKSYLVLLRATGGRLVMQQLFHSDEVRDASEVPGSTRQNREAEVKLARQLIDQITEEKFEPERYEDVVRKRIEKLIQSKLKGKDITEAVPSERPKAEVIDLMEALKASLGAKRRPGAARPAAARTASARASARRSAPRAAAGGRRK
jgi:DNA end-binding protein Ku